MTPLCFITFTEYKSSISSLRITEIFYSTFSHGLAFFPYFQYLLSMYHVAGTESVRTTGCRVRR